MGPHIDSKDMLCVTFSHLIWALWDSNEIFLPALFIVSKLCPCMASWSTTLICLIQEGIYQLRQINLEQAELQLTLPYPDSLFLLSLGALKTRGLLLTTSHSLCFAAQFNRYSEENVERSIQAEMFFLFQWEVDEVPTTAPFMSLGGVWEVRETEDRNSLN